MKQIDLPPEGYRKQDRLGRWVENVDRRLAFWLALGVTALMLFSAWHYRNEAPMGGMLFFLAMGVTIGANIMLVIWPRDR